MPVFRPFGGQLRQKGPEAGTRDAWLPGHNHTRKTLGVQLTEVRGGKAPGVCFRKGPRFPGHHGNPGVPSNNKPAPRGHLRTFAARSEACEALPLVALGFPEPPPRVRQGRDWKNSSFFFFYFPFFSRGEKSRFSGISAREVRVLRKKNPYLGFRAVTAGTRAQAAGAMFSSKRASRTSQPGTWDSGSRGTSSHLQSTPIPTRGFPPRSKRPFRLPGITSKWKEKSRERNR